MDNQQRNEANSHIGLEWGEQFAYEWYHVTESVMRNLARPRKHSREVKNGETYKNEVQNCRW